MVSFMHYLAALFQQSQNCMKTSEYSFSDFIWLFQYAWFLYLDVVELKIYTAG